MASDTASFHVSMYSLELYDSIDTIWYCDTTIYGSAVLVSKFSFSFSLIFTKITLNFDILLVYQKFYFLILVLVLVLIFYK